MKRTPAAVLAVLCLLAAACGGSRSDKEILAAERQNLGDQSGGSVANPPTGPGTTAPESIGGSVGSETTGPGGASQQPGAGPPAQGEAGGSGEGGAPGDSVGTPGETGPIVIASVGNYSGPAGATQAPMAQGVRLWASSINAAGGLFGREVKLLIVDDGGDPAVYASTVQDLVENRGVVAFVNNGATLSMDGGIDYLNEHGIPVIGSECSRQEWYQYPVFFPQCGGIDSGSVNIMRAGKRLTGKTRFGFVACTEAAACRSVKQTVIDNADEAGVEIVYQENISITQIDFTAQCRNAQQANVELMFVIADANTFLRFVRSCERQRFFPQYVAAAGSVSGTTTQQRGLENIIAVGAVFPAHGEGAIVDEFRQAVERFGDGVVTPQLAHGWTAGKLFEEIATRAARARQSIQSETLLEAAHTIHNENLGGRTVALDFSGPAPAPVPCSFVEQGDGHGGWTAPFGLEPLCP